MPCGTGHRDTTPGWFVSTRLAVPLVVEKPGGVGRFGCFDVSDSHVQSHVSPVNGPCLGLAPHDVAQVQCVERLGMLGEFIRPIWGAGHAAELFGSFNLFKGMDEHVIIDVLLVELDPAHLFFRFATLFRAGG